jgi:hypothetical protein
MPDAGPMAARELADDIGCGRDDGPPMTPTTALAVQLDGFTRSIVADAALRAPPAGSSSCVR